MTVTATPPVSGPWVADGVNRDWQFTFKVDSVAHLALRITDEDGTNEEIVTTGFTVEDAYLNQNLGGYVVYPASPSSDPVALDKRIHVYRVVPYSQPTAIGNQGGFYPRIHEVAFDFQSMQIQQLKEMLDRAAVVPFGQTPPDLSTVADDVDAAEDAAASAAASLVAIANLLDSWDALEIAGVTTLAPGSPATVVDVGTPGEVRLQFGIPRGEDGAPGAGSGDVNGPASATDNGFVRFNGTTGKIIKNGTAIVAIADGGTGASTAANAFTAIKQAATLTATGVVELATDAEFIAGTDNSRAVTSSNVVAKEATVADYRANNADRILTTDIVHDAAVEVVLVDNPTIALDLDTFINGVVTLAGNRALGNPTNETPGRSGRIRLVQDGTGSRTLSFGSSWEFASSSPPVLSTAAGAEDILYYDVIATGRVLGNLVKAIG